jgi:hypothetical protein
MRVLAGVLFLGGLLAVASFTAAQPPGGGKGGPGGKGDDKGDKGFPGGKGGKGGFGGGFGPPQPGQVMPAFLQEMLKMTDEQKKQIADLQKDVDAKLDKILTDDQKKQLKEMKDRAKAFTGPPGGGPPGGGPGGFPGFGAGGGSGLFRAPRYAADYPGLAGKELKPGKTIEELQAKDAPKDSKDK